MRLGAEVPNFWAETTKGPLLFHQWKANSWCILFSHPADFTPVCTSELGKMARAAPEFARRGVKLIGHSCDGLDKHRKWIRDIQSYYQDIPAEFPYPVISDESRELAVRLDMLDERMQRNTTAALSVRALYIIGPDNTVRLSMFYPNSTGRSVSEILRVVDSLLLTDKLQVVTPSDWKMGEAVMVVPGLDDEDCKRLFPRVEKVRMPSGLAYVRTTRDYAHTNECWDGVMP